MSPLTQTRKGSLKNTDPEDLVRILQAEGYDFRLNVLDESLEVQSQGIGWERANDPLFCELRSLLRKLDLRGRLKEAEDAIWTHARQNPYHPVKEYLDTLQYDGGSHIADLAGYFTDEYGLFATFLRKWLIWACARAYTGVQGAMLVLDGAQRLGKSQFVRWLAPSTVLYAEAPIMPDDRDTQVRAISRWIWEVSELGATTNRADTEALKSFLTREQFSVRRPYGHFDIVRPALACFVGTVNNSSGFLSDPTGSRRFWTTTLTAIDWNYTRLDRDAVWAEAHAAYLAGEDWRLSDSEARQSADVNETYAPDDPIENLLFRYFDVDPANWQAWFASEDIRRELRSCGTTTPDNLLQKQISAALRKAKCKPKKQAGERGWLGVTRNARQIP